MNRAEAVTAAVAAHRFGLGEASLDAVGADASGWLLAQIGPADAARGAALVSSAEALRAHADFVRTRRARRDMASAPAVAQDMRSGEQQFGDFFRPLVVADMRARLGTAATTRRPFAERLALFWANHFTVSMAKASVRGLVGPFEREAIRPHIAGNFETLLKAAVTHPAMLRYLDNDLSAGPNSALVRRLARQPRPEGVAGQPGLRIAGLNENLAREVLELHTLGVGGGYGQADVTAFAAVLTGWRVPRQLLAEGDAGTRFDAPWHEPGPKNLLGRRYAEGPQALDVVLRDLVQHPSTARFVATKLARHFVADEPPPALVDQLAQTFQTTRGDLPSMYRALIAHPLAWAPAPAKLKTPEEFVIGSARLLGLGEQAFVRQPDGGSTLLGQRVQTAPSPAGWPDRAEDWLGPDAVWKRVEWATRLAQVAGRHMDARTLAEASLGPRLSAGTARELERAADGPQALALLLLSPEFQRR